MYSFLSGIIVEKSDNFIVLENSGIGYEIIMSPNSIIGLQEEQEITIYTRLMVKEDEFSLCGFLSREERSLFDYLLTVSGFGKKSALSVLSNAGSSMIISWIVNEDINSIVKLPGVGKKTAERLVIELRDKFKKIYGEVSSKDSGAEQSVIAVNEDIVLALTGLGFNRNEIARMCSGMPNNLDVEAAIKYALKNKKIR